MLFSPNSQTGITERKIQRHAYRPEYQICSTWLLNHGQNFWNSTLWKRVMNRFSRKMHQNDPPNLIMDGTVQTWQVDETMTPIWLQMSRTDPNKSRRSRTPKNKSQSISTIMHDKMNKTLDKITSPANEHNQQDISKFRVHNNILQYQLLNWTGSRD
jgi:hypothetical protein